MHIKKSIDETIARKHFDDAVQSYSQDFGTFFLARLLRLDIAYSGETCRVDFPVVDFLFNPQGTLHGGIITTVLDISMGHLLRHNYGYSGSTLELKTQYLSAITTPTAWCEARFLKKGKSIVFLESRMFSQTNELAVVASSTWKANKPEPKSSFLIADLDISIASN